MLTKRFDAEVKALGPEGGKKGEFSAVVAVYGNVDAQGDRIQNGAFDESLAGWRKSGDPIPVVLAHDWSDPWSHIGYADPADVKSVPGRGLVVEKAHLDIDDNPVAAQVHRLMERRTLKEFSFGYKVKADGERRAADGAYDLTNLDLIEFGPCLKGVNDSTELLAVKAVVEAEHRQREGKEITMEERMTRLEAMFAKAFPGAKLEQPVEESHEPEKTDEEKALEYEAAHEAAIAEDDAFEKAKADAETKAVDYELLAYDQVIANHEVTLKNVLRGDSELDELETRLEADEKRFQ